jgi:hypothetical protein
VSTQEDRDEATVDAGISAIRRDYYRSVQATVDGFAKRLRAGEWSDLDEVSDAVREETDETYWSIYYHAAFRCLMASDSEGQAWEEAEDMGIELKGHGRDIVCIIAAIAHRLDVEGLVLPAAEEYFEEQEAAQEGASE